MKKSILTIFIIIVICSLFPVDIFAHDASGHNDDLEKVLFGEFWNSNSKSEKIQKSIAIIEAASFLSVDQYNGNGTKELELLREYKVSNLPKTIKEIDFSGNQYHRRYTHMGWDFDYSAVNRNDANWPARKDILLSSVNKVFDFGLFSGKLFGFSQKCNSFSAIVYYVHLIGDHIEDSGYINRVGKMEIASANETGIIDEIIKHCKILFEDHNDDILYHSFVQELTSLNEKVKDLIKQTGGINSDERFLQYHSYSEDLLKLLISYMPKLLEKEDFFKKVFYPE